MSRVLSLYSVLVPSLLLITNKEICMEQYQWNFRSACQDYRWYWWTESARQKRELAINVKKGWQVAAKKLRLSSKMQNCREEQISRILSEATLKKQYVWRKSATEIAHNKKKHWTVSRRWRICQSCRQIVESTAGCWRSTPADRSFILMN